LTHIGHSEKVLVMRAFIVVLVLIFNFQSWTKADDIRDFEIEGISIGDSLLKHFSEDIIKNGIPKLTRYSSDKFIIVDINPSDYEIYESLQFHFKKNSNYKIHSISGANFLDSTEVCYDLMNEIDKQLSMTFKNADREDKGMIKHRADPTGNSTIKSIYYYLEDGNGFRVACFDWSDKLTKEKNYSDHIKVTIFTDEIVNWFTDEAYK